jgi:hypothetical protein
VKIKPEGPTITIKIGTKLPVPAGRGGQDWHALFDHYDRDNSGELDFKEFRRAVRRQSDTPWDSSVKTV